MAMNKLYMGITCEHCGLQATIQETILTNHRKEITTRLNEASFELPTGWMALDWLSKAREGHGYNHKQENVRDSADFCSIECVIKYFQKKRRKLIKEAAERGKE